MINLRTLCFNYGYFKINPFANFISIFPEIVKFSDVFRGYRNGTWTWNGLSNFRCKLHM